MSDGHAAAPGRGRDSRGPASEPIAARASAPSHRAGGTPELLRGSVAPLRSGAGALRRMAAPGRGRPEPDERGERAFAQMARIVTCVPVVPRAPSATNRSVGFRYLRRLAASVSASLRRRTASG